MKKEQILNFLAGVLLVLSVVVALAGCIFITVPAFRVLGGALFVGACYGVLCSCILHDIAE